MTSWFGPRGFQRPLFYKNVLAPAPEPPVFNPLEISGCVLWLDANDSSTIEVNKDLSGANVNRVMKWFDKAKPTNQNYYTHIGSPGGSGLYNVHTINKLNVVYFEPYTAMNHQDGGIAFNFQDRTFFAVIKPQSDMSISLEPYLNIFSGEATGAMQTGIAYNTMTNMFQYAMCSNGIACGIVYDLSNNPVKNRMVLMFAQSSTDLSGNVGSYDTISQPLVDNSLAGTYYTDQTQYTINNLARETAQDVAEIIMYSSVLSKEDKTKVLEYLADKWNLSGPSPSEGGGAKPAPAPAPAPAPPSYTYIIYTQYLPESPNWYWCDENAQVESPPVLAAGYDGTTALRDGVPVNVSGVFYA